MAYIGTEPIIGQYRKLDDISGSFNGSTTTFNLTVTTAPVTAGTAQQLLVSLGGVIQNPNIDYTVSTNTITFTTAPASGLSFFGVLMGDTLNVGTPSDGTVTSAKLASDLTIDLASGTVSAPSLSFDSNTGFYSTADNEVAITTDGTYRAKVDSSGRLLVGTSSARSNFNLYGTNYTAQNQFESGSVPNLALTRGGGAFLTLANITTATNGAVVGVITFNQSDGTNLLNAGQITAEVDGTPGANDMPGRLVFSTTADGASSPTERMRITNGGTLAVGTTGKQDANNVSLAVGATSPATPIETQMSTTSGNYALTFRNPNGLVGSILTSGSSTSFNTSSDYRLKENVVPVADGITRLQQLKPSRFNFIVDPGKTVDGFIAHEVQAVVPEAIHGTKDEVDADGSPIYQGIDQSKLVPLLTAALQEAIGRIETLEAEVAALKAQ